MVIDYLIFAVGCLKFKVQGSKFKVQSLLFTFYFLLFTSHLSSLISHLSKFLAKTQRRKQSLRQGGRALMKPFRLKIAEIYLNNCSLLVIGYFFLPSSLPFGEMSAGQRGFFFISYSCLIFRCSAPSFLTGGNRCYKDFAALPLFH